MGGIHNKNQDEPCFTFFNILTSHKLRVIAAIAGGILLEIMQILARNWHLVIKPALLTKKIYQLNNEYRRVVLQSNANMRIWK